MSGAGSGRRRWLAPEVVQTSGMDCGPAALKCLLEGFGVPVSYGRLREACQTDVDGTSIDTLEVVANQLGLVAEQRLLPVDHLFLDGAAALPALVVVNQSAGGTHFVVAWRRLGRWVQVMDPSTGRGWVSAERFAQQVYRHGTSVPAEDWRAWAGSADLLVPLRQRMRGIGAGGKAGEALIARALADPGWFGLGALDASVRLATSVVAAGGVRTGRGAARLLGALFAQTLDSSGHIFRIVPPGYWMASPDPASAALGELRLLLRGAVVVSVAGRRAEAADAREAPLSRELAAALSERAVSVPRMVWDIVAAEGRGRLALLAAALGLSTGALLIEALLFRGLFDIAAMLTLPGQRAAAVLALVLFSALLLLMEVPIVTESMRIGRHLELRLRMALLRKLPRLPDRYFQSRPISDMADRGHGIHAARLLPGMASNAVQSVCELGLTVLGIALIDPDSAWLAVAIAAAAITVPLVTQPMLRERDLRARNHNGALAGFYLDALLGLVPVRAHRAQKAVSRLHEGLLVEWLRASRQVLGLSVLADAVQSLACLGLAGWLLVRHVGHMGGVTGADLLLVFWTLKLPAIGSGLAHLAQALPAQQNALSRLLEPLAAPEGEAVGSGIAAQAAGGTIAAQAAGGTVAAQAAGGTIAAQAAGGTIAAQAASATVAAQAAGGTVAAQAAGATVAARRSGGMGIVISGGAVVAGGHTILRDIDLVILPGSHVAIVGPSGAGKSSLIGLLLGWHRLSQGSVRIDGAPMTPDGQDALRRATAWVDPGIQVWNRSFADNLGYSAPDGGLARIGRAVEVAGLRPVLRKLPDGMQTRLGEGGALLSGGEGQRVRLGRAFVQQGVRLALLDEPFRGMDRGRRASLLAEARAAWASATLLCVTHDVGETALFDRVLVVEGGRIVEDGSPGVLAAADSRYAALLAAERETMAELWGGEGWRRVAVADGRAMEAS